MSTLKMQESTMQDDKLVKLRQQAVDKDIRYATLENELLKKNEDLLSVKAMLNETLGKFRKEADRVIKLESDLDRQAEDLRAERLNRQNLEASLTAANKKRASEEQTAKFLQMDLDTYASRMSSEHEIELKRLQQEKSTLEARVRMLESQASKPSQLPTLLPRPTTISSAASTALEARIATLESDLSTARLELADATRSLTVARQEAAKVPRLQSDLLTADNARLRAEKDASTQRISAQDVLDQLKELEEELEYWRNTAGERSLDEGRLEDARKERDEAVKAKEEAQKRETALRLRIQELEEAEADLVMGREEALGELHQLQALSPTDSKMNETIIAELRSTLAERESALLNARGFTSELQQMYRDTLSACESAEERVRELELQLQPPEANHPLIIVSPPPSPSPPRPFLAESEPMTKMSAKDEAIVARLLSAIERLRGERDVLRRNLHFAQVEHRVADDTLRARLDATEQEVRRLEKLTAGSAEETSADELSRLHRELDTWREKFERADAELTDRTAEVADKEVEMDIMRVHLREVEDSRDRLMAPSRVVSLDENGGAEPQKGQLEELEQRILRRTEQIGMLQHDTKRLETNLRVAEETIGELTAEVETLGQERACLVDDCAQAREARDGAHRRIDELEVELESLLDHREEVEETRLALRDAHAEVATSTASLETMVRIVAESVTRSRCLHSALKGTRARLATVEANVDLAEDRHARALAETEQLSSEINSMALTIRNKTADMDALTEEINSAKQEIHRLSTAIEDLTSEAQSREQDAMGKTLQHAAAIEILEGRLVAVEESRDALSQLLEAAQLNEREIQAKLEQVQGESQQAVRKVQDLESELAATVARYDAAQVELHGLEHALAAARTHVDEHDASIQALQREKTALQVEHTRLEAELDRMTTKHQYVEQQAKRSDHEVVRLRAEVERLQGEVAKLDEAAQTAEISLSFKTNQYEQKLAMMQRELQKQQSHHQCQDSIAELNEKIEYMEEMLRMKSVEIEENDDRFIEVLKERKRLVNKVDSLTRKVQALQTKLADLTAAPAPSSTSTPPLSIPRPKTPSPPLPHSMPSAGPSNHQPPTRIPSSPAAALRAKTPESSRKTFRSRMITPEPPVPAFPNVTYKTPPVIAASPNPMASESRKRRAPDDFDSPAPGPVDAVVAPVDSTPPRRIRRPTSDGRSGFTPTRNNIIAASQRPMLQQPSPLKRSIVALAETTNSPRGSKPIGLGKPASISKPPMRSWLSRSRALGASDMRSTSILP